MRYGGGGPVGVSLESESALSADGKSSADFSTIRAARSRVLDLVKPGIDLSGAQDLLAVVQGGVERLQRGGVAPADFKAEEGLLLSALRLCRMLLPLSAPVSDALDSDDDQFAVNLEKEAALKKAGAAAEDDEPAKLPPWCLAPPD